MLFDITYKGTHTCTLAPRSKSAPTSPQKKAYNKQSHAPITVYHHQPDMLLNFQTGLRVDIQNLENQETGFLFPTQGFGSENLGFTPSSTLKDSYPYNNITQSFIQSPATSESTYFSTSPCNMSSFGGVHYGQHSESEIPDIISATTSGANSPMVDIDFTLNQWECYPNFVSDNQAFPTNFSEPKE